MLQGLNRKFWYRFATQAGVRRANEDLLTAALVGSLAYAEGILRHELLSILCPDEAQQGATLLDAKLWPRRGGVEPDALLVLNSGTGTRRTVLVETKWDSP